MSNDNRKIFLCEGKFNSCFSEPSLEAILNVFHSHTWSALLLSENMHVSFTQKHAVFMNAEHVDMKLCAAWWGWCGLCLMLCPTVRLRKEETAASEDDKKGRNSSDSQTKAVVGPGCHQIAMEKYSPMWSALWIVLCPVNVPSCLGQTLLSWFQCLALYSLLGSSTDRCRLWWCILQALCAFVNLVCNTPPQSYLYVSK